MSSTVPQPSRAEGREVRLLTAQLDVLAGIVAGAGLGEALDDLLDVVHAVSDDGVLPSVLLVDPDGAHLRHCSAPGISPTYNAAVDGIAIGPAAGSCGTAAHRREQVIVEDIAADPLWDDFRALAEDAGLRACWSTPIISSTGELLGTFAMYYPQPQAPSDDDLALIDVLVRTVTMAIERNRADAEREQALAAERDAALTLQHSLLPEVPPQIGRVQLLAHYRAGDPGVEVGGDWFDAVPTDDGLVIVVGDVQGHDLAAAALMGQLRTVVRASAADGQPPAAILAGAGRYLGRLGSDLLATALVLHLDPDARVLTAASAGHLPPLQLSPGSTGRWDVGYVDLEVGPPLGIGESWPERTRLLPRGAGLLLYTDGLVETRAWTLATGLSMLEEAVQALSPQDGMGRVLDAALDLVPSGLRGDDVAVLAASVPLDGCVSECLTTQRWLPPQPLSASLARSWANGLLRDLSVEDRLRQDCALLVSELVTNAARNNLGPVRVGLAVPVDAGEVLLEVFDRSDRLPQLSEHQLDDTEGRGLRIVERLAAAWGVREERRGKTVWARLT